MIVIRTNSENYYPKTIMFSGGEVHVTLPQSLPSTIDSYLIKAKLKTSQDVMELLMVKNAMDVKYGSIDCVLRLPYLPYARQDRVCSQGEALSIKVMSQLINSMSFNKVITCDNHSDVATALIDGCVDIPSYSLMAKSSEIHNLLTKTKISLCSPDAGANKKTFAVAKNYGGIPVIRADKIRDVLTGEITGTEVYCGDLDGQCVMIIDDICDGGMTFIKLAEALKEKNAGPLFLYVTHGIFSKGMEPLSMFRKIYTTDSFSFIKDRSQQLEVIKL